MNRHVLATQQGAKHLECPTNAQQVSGRCSLHRRRAAAAAALCAQEAAGGAAANSSPSTANSSSGSTRSSSSRHGYIPSPLAGVQQQYWHAAAPAHDVSSAEPRHTAATCPEVALSRSIQAAATWHDLLSMLLGHSRAPQHKLLVQPQRQREQQQPQRQQQRQHNMLQQQQQLEEQALIAAVKQLNSKHLARLLKTLARLQPSAASKLRSTPSAAAAAGASWSRRDQQLFWSLTQLTFSECVEQLPSLSAWELSSTLWAASKLTQPPSPFQLRQLLQQLAQPSILAAASAQDISMSLHAVASLAVQAPEQQLDLLLSASAQRLQDAAPQALANTLWAVATLQHRPQQQWLRQVEAHCAGILQESCSATQQGTVSLSPTAAADSQHQHQQQQGGLEQQQLQQRQRYVGDNFTPHGLYQLIWAMAKLQWQPTGAFQAGFWSASLAQLPHMTPHGTSGVLWAVASLGLQPPEPWTQAWLSGLRAQMQRGTCGAQDLGNVLWAVVRLGLRPDGGWLQDALQATQAVLRTAGTQELSNMLWAFAKLGVRPDAAWMHAWLAAMQTRMSSYCAPALASSIYSLAVLKFRPPRAWAQTLLAEAQRQMPAFGAQELSNLVWALAVLGMRPAAAWFNDFEVQALHESGSFNAQELSIIFWSLTRLQHTPPAPWVASLLREGLEVAGGLQAQSLVLLLGSLTRWDMPQMHGGGLYRVLLPRYWAAAEQLLPDCSLDHLSALYAARVKLGVLPSRQWSSSMLAAVRDRLLALAPAGAARSPSSSSNQWFSSTMHQQPAASALAPQCDRELAALAALQALPVGVLKPAVVSQLIWAAGKLWVQAPVPLGTLRLLMAAAAAVLPQSSWGVLTAIGVGIKQMLQGNRQLATADAEATKAVMAKRPSMRARLIGAPGCKQRLKLKSCYRRSWCRFTWARVTNHEIRQLAQSVWDAWFARSTALLQQQTHAVAAVGDAAAADPQQHLAGEHASALQQQQLERPAGFVAATPIQHQQRTLHGKQLLGVKELSLQLRIVAALRLRPPVAWLDAVMRAAEAQVGSSSAEALSWLLLDLVKVQQRRYGKQLQGSQLESKLQLPEGFVLAVLRRAWVLHAGEGDGGPSGGLTQPQILRLQSVMKQLRKSGAVSDVEWQQWQRLLGVWRANQGLLVA